ncbi:MAG TPA: rhodanese-like domain-containing protein [Ignavibacteriaceae bacterium]|nr:rhodanese-like domain-containing protein [Ignavibacteriaceae bacterium]
MQLNESITMFRKLNLFILVILLITGCTKQGDYKNMSVEELNQKMKSDKDLIVLDVRTEEELRGELGKINGVINIPVQELSTRLNELSNYKDKEVAVICRSGNRSRTASNILSQNGFKKVYNVEGGMIDYRRKISK